jgi:hypothetical protein
MHGEQFFFDNRIDPDRIFQPEFQAQIRAWLTDSETTLAQREAFLQALLDFDDDCGGFYRYRSRLLAAEYLALCPECRQGDAIVDDLLKLSYGYFRVEKADWGTPPEAFVRSARETLAKTDLGRIVGRLEQLVRTTESRGVMGHAARELLRIQPGNRCGIAAIAFNELIYGGMSGYDAQSESFRILVFLSLTHTPIHSDDLAQGISQILVIDGGVNEEYNALQKFIQIFLPHPLIIYKMLLLTACVYDEEAYFYDERIRLRPDVDQLWQEIYQKDPTCIYLLIQAVSSRYETKVALAVLCQLCPEHKRLASLVLDTYKRIFNDAEYLTSNARYDVLDNMGAIGCHHPTVKLELLKIFYTTEDAEVKYIVAINLKRIDPTESEVTSWIMSEIRQIVTSGVETFLSQNLYIRYLWELYARSLAFEDIRPFAIEVWSQAIHQFYGYWSPGLIKALDFVPETIIQHCLEQLQPVIEDDRGCFKTQLILDFLGNFANHPQVTLAAKNFIQTATNHENLYQAAKILLESNAKHPSAIKVLEKILTIRTEHLGDRRGESRLFLEIVYLFIERNINLKFVRRKLLHRVSLPHPHGEHQLWGLARYLSEIDQGNCHYLLATIVHFKAAAARTISRRSMHCYDDNWGIENCFPIEPYIKWLDHRSYEELASIITRFKPELENQSDDFYAKYHAIAWKCAQQLPYKTFREAWKTPIVNPQF